MSNGKRIAKRPLTTERQEVPRPKQVKGKLNRFVKKDAAGPKNTQVKFWQGRRDTKGR